MFWPLYSPFSKFSKYRFFGGLGVDWVCCDCGGWEQFCAKCDTDIGGGEGDEGGAIGGL